MYFGCWGNCGNWAKKRDGIVHFKFGQNWAKLGKIWAPERSNRCAATNAATPRARQLWRAPALEGLRQGISAATLAGGRVTPLSRQSQDVLEEWKRFLARTSETEARLRVFLFQDKRPKQPG